jgi:serine/threonine protein phosphatase PrpC
MSTTRGPIAAAGGSDQGLQRDQNEDRWFADAARGTFGVVDGVGGHPGGEHASEIAVALLRTRLARETGTPAERLREAIALANNAVLDKARQDESLTGMTCVLTAAIVASGQVTVGHVGDTRLYKLRGGAIRKLTRDHSPVGEREDAGELTESEAMRHPRRNEVYRDVGAEPRAPDDEDFVDIVEEPFEEDAALLICSDGLSDQVSSASLRRIVEAHAGRPADAVQELIRAANDAGGKDNVSAVVVEGRKFARARGRDFHGTPNDWWTSWWFMLLAGVAAGVAVTAFAAHHHPQWFRRPAPAVSNAAAVEARRWRVGLTGEADAVSIADAVSRAQAGDIIVLAPGDYREQITIRMPLTLTGTADAVIRPPLGAAPDWTAITVTGTEGVRLEGFTIGVGDGQRPATGVRVEHGDVVVSGLRVSGTSEAALLLGEGARATVTSSDFTDNPGSAIVVSEGARLTLRHSTVRRNGTAPDRRRPAVVIADGAEADLAGNAIGDNGGPAIEGWPADRLPWLLEHNLVHPTPRAPQRRGGASEPARPGPVRSPR